MLLVVFVVLAFGCCECVDHGFLVGLNQVSSIDTSSLSDNSTDNDDDYDEDYYEYDDEAEETRDGTGCPGAFMARCVCGLSLYQGKNKFVTNCTDTGFTNASVLRFLPESTQVLLFTGNYVKHLPANLFGQLSSFDDLETIDLSNNKINEIDGRAFHRVANLQTLILNHNNLSIVESHRHIRVFSNLKRLQSLHLTNTFADVQDSRWYLVSLESVFLGSKLNLLKKLHLEQNDLRVFSNKRLFCALPSLEQLYLGSNRLTDLDFDLDCLQNITYIDLEFNSIRRLSPNSTALLDRLTVRNRYFSVRLTGNPFVCDCSFRHFLDWLQTTRVKVREFHSYRCFDGASPRLQNILLSKLRPLLMPCVLATHQRSVVSSGSSVVLPTLLAFLTVFFSVLVAFVVYMYRDIAAKRVKSVSRCVSRSVSGVVRSRQYVNIGQQANSSLPTAV